MNSKGLVGNQKGFTLIEIIAVLVLLGILAAVAIPKYIDLQASARTSAAQAAIAEVQARASQYYAKHLLDNAGSNPTMAQIVTAVGAVPDLGSDFTVAFAANDAGTAGTITVSAVKGTSLSTAVTGTWTLPTQ